MNRSHVCSVHAKWIFGGNKSLSSPIIPPPQRCLEASRVARPRNRALHSVYGRALKALRGVSEVAGSGG